MRFKQMIAAITAASFLSLGMHTTASAGVIGTPEYLSAADRAGQLARIESTLSRADVQAQLVAMEDAGKAVLPRITLGDEGQAQGHLPPLPERMASTVRERPSSSETKWPAPSRTRSLSWLP